MDRRVQRTDPGHDRRRRRVDAPEQRHGSPVEQRLLPQRGRGLDHRGPAGRILLPRVAHSGRGCPLDGPELRVDLLLLRGHHLHRQSERVDLRLQLGTRRPHPPHLRRGNDLGRANRSPGPGADLIDRLRQSRRGLGYDLFLVRITRRCRVAHHQRRRRLVDRLLHELPVQLLLGCPGRNASGAGRLHALRQLRGAHLDDR